MFDDTLLDSRKEGYFFDMEFCTKDDVEFLLKLFSVPDGNGFFLEFVPKNSR